ncbi:8'-apo-carotenoid 13,14-cleaving dioxygenase [Pelagerythrobacter marinus]|uniref:8'-apo-carotenoid 13,14-cleaving dioxygenase n=1 Tax=Pelagerythrobacter marinus TaxID=538382 RepID=UPI0020369686|nr:carotenoid oxygenase family protein [Pelagerythrobacter marinus]USA40520.1 carotenoid oxygenase family protein [Pelagerythrobacter marinus]WPZ08310.1 carotenoid oxygenase family protein [Pelagerythrobacter marinus]
MASVLEKTIRGAVTAGIGKIAAFNRSGLEQDNPFTQGLHAPMQEELTLEDLPVTGTIPAALDGRYLRIGPNPEHADPRGHHWFVGDGMVHGVRIAQGRARWYRNRYVRSRALEEVSGLPAAPGPRRGMNDTVNTNVIPFGTGILALVEAGSYPAELSDDLETLGYSDFGGGLAGSFTAHPHRDPATGEYHAICYDAARPDRVTHVALDPAGKVMREVPIAVEHGPSIHDCALTASWVVIFDLPVTLSMKALIAGHRFPYRWNPAHRARVGLLPRDGDAAEVTWHDVDPAYVFHVANSFEDAEGRVVVDCCAYETMFDGAMPGPFGRNLGLERWTVDPAGGKVARETLSAAPQEFPRCDERHFTRPCRHVWTVGLPDDASPEYFASAPLYRHDLRTGETVERSFGADAVPGEFVFVPGAPDAAEGEGWVMGFVIDRAKCVTDLAILDSMTLEDVARIHVPHVIPPGFHGNWVAAF